MLTFVFLVLAKLRLSPRFQQHSLIILLTFNSNLQQKKYSCIPICCYKQNKLSLVHTDRMSGSIGRFNRNRSTFGPCVLQPIRFCRRDITEKGLRSANRLPISTPSHWLRALTGVFWWGARPLSEHNITAGEIAVLTNIRLLVQRLRPELSVFFNPLC